MFNRIYFLFAALILLYSCNIEKRQYRSGYYISSLHVIKNNQTEKTHSELSSDFRAVDKNEKSVSTSEEKITGVSSLPLSPSYSTGKKIPYTSKSIHSASVKEEDFKKQNKRQNTFKTIYGDEEKVPKDVKNLLLASIGSFILAVFYGIFSIAGFPSLTNIIFILTPFAIIGIWIFALLLYTKYSTENSSNSTEIKPKEERLIKKRRAFLLAGLLGIFGVHRFYLGYTKMGILEMLTLGGFFVLYFIDLIRIKNGKLKPKKGEYDPEKLTNYKVKKKKIPNQSQKLVKIALLISVAALMIILGFAIFF